MATLDMRPSPATSSEIPIVDIGGFLAGDRAGTDRAAADLRSALENIGFFILTGHGFDWRIVEGAFSAAKRFFDLPAERKREVALESGSFADLLEKKGYIGFDGSSHYSGKETSNVESYYFEHEAAGLNRWLEDFPGFKEAILGYLERIDTLAHRLLPLYARALDLDDDRYFSPFFERPVISLRVSHYPPATPGSTRHGLIPHTDRSFMTLLPSNTVAGLHVRPEGMEWIDAPVVPESFVVNSGDTLKRWSNDRFISTPHRVLPPRQDRYALPFFFSPDGSKVLEPLASCIDADRPARYPPISSDDYIRDFMRVDYKSDDPRLRVN